MNTAIWRSLLPALLAWPEPLPAASRRCSVVQMGLIGGAGLHPASSSSVVACKWGERGIPHELSPKNSSQDSSVSVYITSAVSTLVCTGANSFE